jgi:hypothetical protein
MRAMVPRTGPEIQALLAAELVSITVIVVVCPSAVKELEVIELVEVEGELEVDGELEVGLIDKAKDDGE